MAPGKQARLYKPVRLGRTLEAAITAYGDAAPGEEKDRLREALVRRIERYAYNRKYDGEFLARERTSANKRSPKHEPRA